MAFATPYITDDFTAYKGDVTKTLLSLAICFIDDFTGKEIVGKVKAVINEGNLEAIKNLSGYYIFINLETDNFTVQTKSELYFPTENKVDSSSIDPNNPVFIIRLKPKPEYPFPDNATLFRGLVISSLDEPIEGARIVVEEKNIETITDSKGEFVVYLEATTQEEKMIMKIGSNEFTIAVKEGKNVFSKYHIFS